jgi:hypothetical protein
MTVRILYLKYNLKLSIGEKIVSDIVIIYNIMLAEQYYTRTISYNYWHYSLTNIYNAVVGELPARMQP